MSKAAINCNYRPGVHWETVSLTSLPVKGDDFIHTWKMPVAEDNTLLNTCRRLLNTEEKQRAERYFQAHDRNRFLTSRACLRQLVGNYLGIDPVYVVFEKHSSKKPYLSKSMGGPLHYNVAHSGNWILISLASEEIGVDIEERRPSFDFQDIVANSFSLPEQQYLREQEDATSSFYELWTRKEALLKATSTGINDFLPAVPSLRGLHAVEPAVIGSALPWQVDSFEVAEGYTGSIAYAATQQQEPRFFYLNNDAITENTNQTNSAGQQALLAVRSALTEKI